MNTLILLYSNIFLILNILICYIEKVSGENNYYIISIRRSSKDKEYDDASKKVQLAIDELVNDRMNDIYDIISEHQDTYIKKNGEQDEKLEELVSSSQLKKRHNHNPIDCKTKNNKKKIDKKNINHKNFNGEVLKKNDKNYNDEVSRKNNTSYNDGEVLKEKNIKFLFLNVNRPQSQNIYKRSQNTTEIENKEIVEFIPIESKLVNPLCPVLNYYTVRAYLSDDIIEKIKKLPNVIRCEKIIKAEKYSADNHLDTFYSKEQIQEEAKWKDVNVQENKFDFNLTSSHLSLISQGRVNDTILYDNNYYYPSSAGKGIDIFIIDSGINILLNKDDFDQYQNTEDERTVICDGKIYDGQYHPVTGDSKYACIVDNEYTHGTIVAAVAAGTISGVAKKANIHMLAAGLSSDNDLVAFDYIKQYGKPHKTVINISRGYYKYIKNIEDKINELINSGFIIFASSGNSGMNACDGRRYYSSFSNVISVGSINNENIKFGMDSVYSHAYWSNFGDCITFHAPGYVKITSASNEVVLSDSGTSFSSPIVAGVAALVMSENSEKDYTYETIKKELIDLSIKNVIRGIFGKAPNQLINNGKKIIYQPPRCDDPSGLYKCTEGCCTKHGHCVKPEESSDSKSLCYVENGCLPDYGQCFSSRCDSPLRERDCTEDECCSKNGKYVNIFKDPNNYCFIENGCQTEFSDKCLSLDKNYNDSDKYDLKKYQERIDDFSCAYELQPYKACDFEYDISLYTKSYFIDKCKSYEKANCREFFKAPLEYAPSCKNTIDRFKYPLLNVFSPTQMEIRTASRNLICAREDDQNPESMCGVAEQQFIYRFFPDKPHFERACRYRECYQASYKFYENLYYEYQNLSKNDPGYNYFLNVFGTFLNYLDSDECLSLFRNQTLSSLEPQNFNNNNNNNNFTSTLDTEEKEKEKEEEEEKVINDTTTTTTSPKNEINSIIMTLSPSTTFNFDINSTTISTFYTETTTFTKTTTTTSSSITTITNTPNKDKSSTQNSINHTKTKKKSRSTTTLISSIKSNRISSSKTVKATKSIIPSKTKSSSSIKKIPTSTVPGKCGPGYGVCAETGSCCSKYGYCGTSSDHCGDGCQEKYGHCSSSSSISKAKTRVKSTTTMNTSSETTATATITTTTKKISIPTSTVPGKCGPGYGTCAEPGTCCSKYGYCGTSSDHCGDGCQSEYGRCSSTTTTDSASKSSPIVNGIPTSTVPGKCGPGYGACAEPGTCCSKYGYCGTSNDYCGHGCQPTYGICY
jgi:subtilisin family serine protease